MAFEGGGERRELAAPARAGIVLASNAAFEFRDLVAQRGAAFGERFGRSAGVRGGNALLAGLREFTFEFDDAERVGGMIDQRRAATFRLLQ